MMATSSPAANTRKRCDVLVLGSTGTGKTTLVNTIAGSGLPVGDGVSLLPCTKAVQIAELQWNDYLIVMHDIPDLSPDENIGETADAILKALVPQPQCLAIVYLIDISQSRNTLSKNANLKIIDAMYQKRRVLHNVLFATTMWPQGAAAEREEAREEEYEAYLKDWKDRGAILRRFDHEDTSEDGRNAFLKDLLERAVLTYSDVESGEQASHHSYKGFVQRILSKIHQAWRALRCTAA